MGKHLYIETVGCQMNVLDSELVVAGLLEANRYFEQVLERVPDYTVAHSEHADAYVHMLD